LKFLLDTNIWLEILLKQKKAFGVKRFLESAKPFSFFLTDFSFYSIGIYLLRSKKHEVFLKFSEDLLVRGGVKLIRNEMADMINVVKASKSFKLDFDDAYQYAVAEKYDLTIISFDADFDRTARGRETPEKILKTI